MGKEKGEWNGLEKIERVRYANTIPLFCCAGIYTYNAFLFSLLCLRVIDCYAEIHDYAFFIAIAVLEGTLEMTIILVSCV
jgi:hypothetical protein